MSSTAQYDAPDPVRQRIRVDPTLPPVDMPAAQKAATDLLAALGVGLDSETMADTPRRMAQMYADMLSVPAFELTTFENIAPRGELLLVEDIPVRSLCEHHMLPFVGVAHVGYLPGERILGPSKFAGVVDYFGRRPQTQERMTEQVAEYLQEQLSPRGIGVVIEAEHSCQALRWMGAVGARTRTSTLLGALRLAWSSRAEFLSLTRGRRNHHE